LTASEVKAAQAAWAKYLGRKVEETIDVGDGVTMTLVLVPPGTFRIGAPEGEAGRNPWEPRFDSEVLHGVTLTEPFDLGKTEVTQAQYQALTGHNPSHFKGADLPVETVSWEEAQDYAARLTNRRGDHHLYRLPTEAEWEFACRGGRPSSQPFGVGGGRALSSREANCNGNFPYGAAAKGPHLGSTCPVGSYAANALGLHDMHGNVWEWCADCFGPYPQDRVTDPTGPAAGPTRVHRGGSWFDSAGNCRAAIRASSPQGRRGNHMGFRLARSVPSGGK
jgi:formylglycine-generating enzyme required for sulfatase activity